MVTLEQFWKILKRGNYQNIYRASLIHKSAHLNLEVEWLKNYLTTLIKVQPHKKHNFKHEATRFVQKLFD